ncbi:MAG: cysteine desulfurase [Gammaproteobacteria bacterium AqS3]|nr:cysteine desulfurase [Gammaproteobacteria bacterium AqS3]
MSLKRSIYLDYQASTPLDPRVKKAMAPYMDDLFANPHANTYLAGIDAGNAVRDARRKVASSIGVTPASIIFTSGATEANNLAIFGVARAASPKRKKVITLASEHKSVLEPVLALRRERFEVLVLPVGRSGLVDLEKLKEAVGRTTLLVSVMHVNNETGVVQPLADIARICRKAGALFHSDCAQTLGRLPLRVPKIGADLVTLSSHKCCGPKGIGALYVRREPRVPIEPILLGGGQERGLRSGTLPVPLCVGFGEACRIAKDDIKKDMKRISKLEGLLIEGIRQAHPGVQFNGSEDSRAPGSFSIRLDGALSEQYLYAFEPLQISTGSACASTDTRISSVLRAYGLSKVQAICSLRFGIGRFTTEEEIRTAVSIINKGTKRLGVGR